MTKINDNQNMDDLGNIPQKDVKEIHKRATQKITINPNGSIDVEWVQPEFSDILLDFLPDEKKINQELNKGKKPRIFCG